MSQLPARNLRRDKKSAGSVFVRHFGVIMLIALGAIGYGLIAGFLYGQSPYGLHPVVAGLLVAFAGLTGGLAAATIDRIE